MPVNVAAMKKAIHQLRGRLLLGDAADGVADLTEGHALLRQVRLAEALMGR